MYLQNFLEAGGAVFYGMSGVRPEAGKGGEMTEKLKLKLIETGLKDFPWAVVMDTDPRPLAQMAEKSAAERVKEIFEKEGGALK